MNAKIVREFFKKVLDGLEQLNVPDDAKVIVLMDTEGNLSAILPPQPQAPNQESIDLISSIEKKLKGGGTVGENGIC